MSKSSYISKKIEKGQFLVIFGLLLIVFLGILAFVVDGGRIYIEQRRTQNAADNAAIAAGLALCRGEETGLIVNEGRYIAGENGYDNDGTSNIVTINLPPVYGSSAGRNGAVEAIVQSEIPGTFGQIIGVDSFTVTSRAVTICTQGGAYAIFAGGEDCDKQIEWSGSTSEVNGKVHSNGNIDISGSNNEIYGDITWVDPDSSYIDGSTILDPATGNPSLSGVLPYPIKFNEDYYSSGPSGPDVHSFSGKIDNGALGGLLQPDPDIPGGYVLSDGIYYTPDDIDLSFQRVTGNSVTFVAGGTITISGSDQVLKPHVDNLLAFSYQNPDNQCSDMVVKFAGSDSEWQGIIYAPFGGIDMSGSDNTTINGSLIGYKIKMPGSVLGVNVIEEEGNPRISLIE